MSASQQPPDQPDEAGPDASSGPPDAAASGPLTPGGARLRHPPVPEPDEEAEVPGLPRIPLKQYYLAVVMLLVGIGVGLYGVVDIYEGRGADDGGFTTVSVAKVLLGVVLAGWGQRILRDATHDPRAGKPR